MGLWIRLLTVLLHRCDPQYEHLISETQEQHAGQEFRIYIEHPNKIASLLQGHNSKQMANSPIYSARPIWSDASASCPRWPASKGHKPEWNDTCLVISMWPCACLRPVAKSRHCFDRIKAELAAPQFAFSLIQDPLVSHAPSLSLAGTCRSRASSWANFGGPHGCHTCQGPS